MTEYLREGDPIKVPEGDEPVRAVFIGQEWQAGPELDAEIARRVFDHSLNYDCPPFHGPMIDNNPPRGALTGLPKYSAKIAAAWLVVEKMRERGYHFVMLSASDGLVSANFFLGPADKQEGVNTSDTAPLTICRAALAALDASR